MDKLRPCPFCGHEAMICYNSDYDFQAYCTNDSCFMSQIIMEDMETEEQAREAWNKRAPSVPAVPLDKLCEWLQENASLTHGTLISAAGWKYELTRWMEGLDAAD